jgi:hypothetical protein
MGLWRFDPQHGAGGIGQRNMRILGPFGASLAALRPRQIERTGVRDRFLSTPTPYLWRVFESDCHAVSVVMPEPRCL